MKKLSVAFLLWIGLANATLAQTAGGVPATMVSISVAGTVTAGTKIISGISGKSIYLTSINLVPAATSIVSFVAGTGTNCGSNAVALTGTMTFTTQGAINLGVGYGAVLVAPQGYDVCIKIGTATAPGSIAYAQY